MGIVKVIAESNISILDIQEKIFDVTFNHGLEVKFDWINEGKGRRISMIEDKDTSVYDLLEESVIVDESDVFIYWSRQLPYPLNNELEVFALVESCEENKEENNYLAIVGKKQDRSLKELFSVLDVRTNWGYVKLAGFGPGDKFLLTKKTEYNLYRSEVIFYDDLVDEEYLRKFCAKKVYVGKRKGEHKFDQEKINELMYQEAIKGKWVVRIKGGDPLIFGRGAEEYHYLKSRFVDSEIIPGISSAFAAAASAVIPFTERSLSSSVVFLSGHDLIKLKIPKADTLVFFMGASNQKELAGLIINEGWDENTPVGIVHNASKPQQKVYRGDLADLKHNGSGLPSPSIIIVGKTAGGYNEQQKRWLYTGASLEEVKSKSQYVHTPLISIEALKNNQEVNTELFNLTQYNRIVFTSRYAVYHFFNCLNNSGLDARSLGGIEIDSIGKTTSKALFEKGLVIAPLSNRESIDGMLETYGKKRIFGENVLVPCSNQSSGALQKGLRRLGNRVKELQVYNVVKSNAIVKQNLDRFEGIVFSSPATVEAFAEAYGDIPKHIQIKCRGRETEKAVERLLINTIDNYSGVVV